MTESTHNTRPSPFEATVVAAYGRRFEVRAAAGQHHHPYRRVLVANDGVVDQLLHHAVHHRIALLRPVQGNQADAVGNFKRHVVIGHGRSLPVFA